MQVHQIWISDIIPEKIQAMMLSWRTSGNKYKLWRKEDLAIYDEEFNASGMKMYHEELQRDLYRLFILRDFGGLYVDCDTKLNATLPDTLPSIFCGNYAYDLLMPDPWIIYSSHTNNDQIVSLINEGMKMTNGEDPLHRFGYKAFVRRWKEEILDTKAWITHANNFSWRDQTSRPVTTRRK